MTQPSLDQALEHTCRWIEVIQRPGVSEEQRKRIKE
jgi:hypothetical protein